MQRKNLFVLYVTLSSIIFTGVSSSSTSHATQVNSNKSQIEISNNTKTEKKDVKITSAKIKKHTKKYTYKNKDKKVIMEAVYDRPILSGNFASFKKINKFYEEQEKRWLSSFESYLKEAKELSTEEYFHTYTDNVSYKVTYNQKGYLSIITSGYLYTGGAHGNPYTTTYTVDLNTGKELKLTDIMKGSNQTINTKIYKAFEKKINSDKNGYFSDALQTVKSTAGKNSNFYLKKAGVYFYYDVYMLAPYAAGMVEASIPFTSKNTFKLSL